MKFWQLLTVADSQGLILDAAPLDPNWSTYGEWIGDLADVCGRQDRTKLDHVLPNAFVQEVLTGCARTVFCSAGQLRSYRFEPSDAELSLVEAFDRFGVDKLEEALEKGSASVGDALVGGEDR